MSNYKRSFDLAQQDVETLLWIKRDKGKISLEKVSEAIGIDRKTLQARVKNPSTFRGYELSLLYRFLKFTPEEQVAFNREVTK